MRREVGSILIACRRVLTSPGGMRLGWVQKPTIVGLSQKRRARFRGAGESGLPRQPGRSGSLGVHRAYARDLLLTSGQGADFCGNGEPEGKIVPKSSVSGLFGTNIGGGRSLAARGRGRSASGGQYAVHGRRSLWCNFATACICVEKCDQPPAARPDEPFRARAGPRACGAGGLPCSACSCWEAVVLSCYRRRPRTPGSGGRPRPRSSPGLPS